MIDIKLAQIEMTTKEKTMDETTIGWILGVFGVVIAFLLNSLRIAIDTLRSADKLLVDRVIQWIFLLYKNREGGR